jgi:hypothetical protein
MQGDPTSITGEPRPNRFRFNHLAEAEVRRPPKVLVENGINRGDHVAIFGPIEFAYLIAGMFGEDVRLLLEQDCTPRDGQRLVQAATEARTPRGGRCGDGPAAILYLGNAPNHALYDWYSQFPDCILKATSASRAEVLKFRHHPSGRKTVVIERGVARVVDA